LETLGPTERAVFVLRDIFGFEFDEIAATLDKTPAAVRQIAHRARAHVEARRPRVAVTAAEARAALDGFRVAVETGDPQAILDVLAPDVVLMSDGGGVKQAALRPIVGADKVARFIVGGMRKAGAVVTAEATVVNGNPALALSVGGELDGVLTARIQDGRITGLYFVRNPEKLTRLTEEVTLALR
ncbi:MAG: nuclear transport factor 2 family protein, partial [Leifsonia sp.]|nr:nuclear transport factor 2 family protein [Leifsonia sp.]